MNVPPSMIAALTSPMCALLLHGRRQVSKMTSQQATTFGRYSGANAGQVKAVLKCGCEPYQDVFTYKRWKAQGQQVQRGQHAIKLPVVGQKDVEDDDGNIRVKRYLATGAVFCRHQVAPIGSKASPVVVTGPEPPIPTPEPQAQPQGNNGQSDMMAGWRLI